MMFRFDRPPEPSAFMADEDIKAAKSTVQDLYRSALRTLVSDEDGPSFPKDLDFWGKYKSVFAAQQSGRCGFCELVVIGGQPGDVEHYRPKGRVRILDPDQQGTEKEDLSNIVGRKHIREFGTGYWWLAYIWHNYLLACNICNRGWKRDFFPIPGPPEARRRPTEAADEAALLLNPFDDNPGDHLGYEVDGTIRAKTERGLATIETVGLWRPSLVLQRRPVLINLDALIREMNGGSDELVRSHMRTIFSMGALEWPTFPGMVRIFFTDRTGISWEELTTLRVGS